MNRFAGLFLAAAVVALAPACSDIPLGGNPAEDPAIRAIAASGRPKMGRIAIAPIATMTLASDEATKGWSLAETEISAAKVQQDIARALEASGSYERVRIATGNADDVWNEHDDFVVTVSVDEIRTHWDGHNGWWGPNIANFLVWGFPAWWVADNEYSISGNATITVSSGESRNALPVATVPLSSKGTFDQWDRGWHFLGTFYTSLEPAEWRGVFEKLFPAGERDLTVGVAGAVEKTLRDATESPVAVQKLHQKTLVLAVGVKDYRDQVNFPPLDFADDDARKVVAALERNGIAPEHVKVLVDSAATAQAVRDAITGHLSRARASDSIVLYVAAYGTRLQDGRPAILFHDAVRGKDDGKISLEDLAKALEGIKGSKLVIVDSGFGDHGRAIASRAAGQVNDLAAFESRSIAAILAGGPQDPALSPQDLGMGLLSFYVVRGLEGKADSDHDGHLPAQELFTFVRPRVVAEAAYGGDPQTPRSVALDKGPVLELRAADADTRRER